MPTEVIMPALGMAQETGKVLRWLKRAGDTVSKGEPLMEIETDKVTVEIEAPADGTLAGVSAGEGEDVPVGRVVAFVVAEDEEFTESVTPVAAVVPAPAAPAAAQTNGSHSAEPQNAPPRRVLASPKARRLARERGISIDEVRGTGPRGAIQAADVLAVVESAPAPVAPGVSSAWKTMASRMQASWRDVPHFFLERDLDAERLNSWRETTRRRPGYEQVTHTDLLIVVCATALAEHPRVNSTWRDDDVHPCATIDVGIAVATNESLIVPVVHNADQLDLRTIAQIRADLVERARARRLRPDDVRGGTFTISNLGMFGVDAFHAIVNTPQAAILAVGRIRDRVVPVGGEAAVRPMMTVSLSFDHRVVDGAEGARFLETIAGYVEEPAALLR